MTRSTAVPLSRQRTLLAQERRTDPGLDAFIHALDRYPNLTPAEARHLCLRAQEGDTAARDRLVECHLRLLVSVAKGYIGRGVPLMDLIQEGSIGLLTAIEKYDPDKSRFITHASWWIWDSVSKAASAQARLIRLPHHVQAQLNRTDPERLTAELARARQLLSTLSLDYETASGQPFGETLRLEAPSLYEQAVEEERVETLYRHLRACLLPREREVVYLRYGLQAAYREHSLEEIAAETGMSRRQVKMQHDLAIEKLRAAYGLQDVQESA